MSISALPQILVAPNGARRTQKDHPALPVHIDEIVRDAIACQRAGAGGMHAHVRDAQGAHVLDAGLYRELLVELARKTPGFVAQITTEAVGRYTPLQQRQLVRDVMPGFVSIALREMVAGEPEQELKRFYNWAHEAGIGVQHILYAPEEVLQLATLVREQVIPETDLEVLFVLGRYTENQQSSVGDLTPFVARRANKLSGAQWAVCAFGQQETVCLAEAIRLGGKARIGFENNLLNQDGSVAVDNAARVRELISETGPETRAAGKVAARGA
ncbi:3-keto-5-aminohexanoate cleavage protein [Candidatus Halocynthiibacter alkanivorans]|uniref:3-keto-5-aminohexanoate cleavage protein n=1 Tax=Candidatus Halocynthiibacter alkanivorans TaxID=2267619 RepID=UPI003AF393E5